MSTDFDDLPLRARKRALLRRDLCEALVERLATRSLDEVGVAELCEQAQVSHGTFFNHFPTKGDLLTYFIQVWSLQMAARARELEREQATTLALLESILRWTAEATHETPAVLLETIAHQARLPPELTLRELDEAERRLHLPQVDDVMALSDAGLGGLLPPLLRRAIARGELPPATDIPTAMLAITGVFFGAPLVLARRAPHLLGDVWARQLQLVWAGFHATFAQANP